MTEDTYALLTGAYDVHTRFSYSFQAPDYINPERLEALAEDIQKQPGLEGIVARVP